jgi:hypothetical protein
MVGPEVGVSEIQMEGSGSTFSVGQSKRECLEVVVLKP